MEKIKNKYKSYRLSHQNTFSAATFGVIGTLIAANLINPDTLVSALNSPKEIKEEIETDSEILLLNTISDQITYVEEGITLTELRENVLNTISSYQEENENISKDMNLVFHLIEMRFTNALENNLSLEETRGNIYRALIDGYAIKGQVIGKDKEEVREDWGLTLTFKN